MFAANTNTFSASKVAQAKRLEISTSFDMDLASLDVKTPTSASTASPSSSPKSLSLDWAHDDLDDLDWDEDREEDNLRIDTKTGFLVTAAEHAIAAKNAEPVYEWGQHLKYRYMPTIVEAEEPEEPLRIVKPFVAQAVRDAISFDAISSVCDSIFAEDSTFEVLASISASLFTDDSAFEVFASISPISDFETASDFISVISSSVFTELSASDFLDSVADAWEACTISSPIDSDTDFTISDAAPREPTRLERILAYADELSDADLYTFSGYHKAVQVDCARHYQNAIRAAARRFAPVSDEDEDEEFTTGIDEDAFYNYVEPIQQARVDNIVLRIEHAAIADRRSQLWMINDPWIAYDAKNAPQIAPLPAPTPYRPAPLPPAFPSPAADDNDDEICLEDSAPLAPKAYLKLREDYDWETAELDVVRSIFPRIQNVPGPGHRFANERRETAQLCRFDHPTLPALPATLQYNLGKPKRTFPISAARFNYNSRWAAPPRKEVEPVAIDTSFEDDLSCKPTVLRSIARAATLASSSSLSVFCPELTNTRNASTARDSLKHVLAAQPTRSWVHSLLGTFARA